MAAIGAWAVATDRVSYTVTHGISMNPVYYQGDLVVIVKSSEYQIGEIAEYRSPETHEQVLHRIIGGGPVAGYVFKGDNNQSVDAFTPTGDQITGRAVFHVPHGGIWLKPLLSPTGLGMMGFLIVGGGAAAPRSRREVPRGRRKKKVKAMSSQGGPGGVAMAVIRAVIRLSPPLRLAAGAVTLTAILAVALGIFGWINPLYRVEPAVTGTSQSMTYSYSAAVPRSAAYDGVTVLSPDPIFRKLTNKMTVRVHYQGPPGTLAVSAELASGTGWHTTIPMVTGKRFSTSSQDVTVPLDLNAFDRRAKDAAAATGLPAAQILITLNTRVTRTGLSDFSAPLKLTLAPLQLSMADNAGALVVTNAAAQTPARTVVRKISIMGVSLMTAANARSWAVLLLIGAAAGTAVLLFVTRRGLPLRNRAEIERRFPQLLVHVEPMTTSPGMPVVIVDNFPALAKLAVRYGQMVLTWRGPDGDDFVVRDEGITYRYRVPLDEPVLHNVERVDRPAIGSHRRKASTP